LSENVTGGVLRELWSGAVQTLRSYWTGPYSTRDPAAAEALGLGPTSTGIYVNSDTAFNSSAYWSGVCIISQDIASVPLELLKKDKDGGSEPFVDSKTYELVHDAPNGEMTSMVFRESMQAHTLTWGNAYAEIERDGAGRPTALWPITPDRVTPFRQDRRVKYRVRNATSTETILEAGNVLHVPGLGFDGLIGYSVIEKARESIGMGLAMQRFGGSFFGNGTSFGGVVSFKQERLTPEFKQGVRESINAMHSGVDRAHKFLLLGGEAKYDRLGIPPNDAQFLESRRFEIEEIARWLTMPQHKLNGLDHATFSNIEHLDLEYYKSCLRGKYVRWEQELKRKLIPSLERKVQYFRHNVEGFLRGDSAARGEFYSKMFNMGVYSINMILDKEGQNRIGPDGDVHFVNGNLVPIDRAINPPKPLPVVTEVKPKALPAADEDDGDEEQKALRVLLSEIAANTAALRASMVAEREAMSQAERERHAAEVDALKADALRLQEQLEAHGDEAEQLAAQIAAARAETETARTAREDAEAALATAEQAAEAQAAAAESRRMAGLLELSASAQALQEQLRTEAHTAASEAEAARLTADQAEAVASEALNAIELTRAEMETAQRQAELVAEDIATKLAAAEQQREAAEQAVTEAAAALVAQRAAETARLAGMVGAHRALIVHAMNRIVREEADKARRHQAKLKPWLEIFYASHEETCMNALRPVIRVHLAWKQSTEDVDAVTLALVREHITDSTRQLCAVVDSTAADELSSALERMLTRWEQQRPEALADRFLAEEIAYVHASR
jgi:HK97 family phage portal protein